MSFLYYLHDRPETQGFSCFESFALGKGKRYIMGEKVLGYVAGMGTE